MSPKLYYHLEGCLACMGKNSLSEALKQLHHLALKVLMKFKAEIHHLFHLELGVDVSLQKCYTSVVLVRTKM